MICIIAFKDGSVLRLKDFINEWSPFVMRRVMESNPNIVSINWETQEL